MTTADKDQTLLGALNLFQAANDSLLQVSRTCANQAKLDQIISMRGNIDYICSQIGNARVTADDAEFLNATLALKVQATSLCTDQAAMGKIVDDVGLAGKIFGDLAKAIHFIGLL